MLTEHANPIGHIGLDEGTLDTGTLLFIHCISDRVFIPVVRKPRLGEPDSSI